MIKFRIFFSFLTFAYITSPKANDPKDLDLLGIKINYGNGSWVNPNEKIFKLKIPLLGLPGVIFDITYRVLMS